MDDETIKETIAFWRCGQLHRMSAKEHPRRQGKTEQSALVLAIAQLYAPQCKKMYYQETQDQLTYLKERIAFYIGRIKELDPDVATIDPDEQPLTCILLQENRQSLFASPITKPVAPLGEKAVIFLNPTTVNDNAPPVCEHTLNYRLDCNYDDVPRVKESLLESGYDPGSDVDVKSYKMLNAYYGYMYRAVVRMNLTHNQAAAIKTHWDIVSESEEEEEEDEEVSQ